MKVATRNVLAELLVEALDDPVMSGVVLCLAFYGRACGGEPRSVAIDDVLPSTNEFDLAAVKQRLRECPLLATPAGDQIHLASQFDGEWVDVNSQLARYAEAMEEWTKQPQASQQVSTVDEVIQKGAVLFNHWLFFEVHEVLEPKWMNEQGDVKSFLQGLIQIAVAFYHLGRGNLDGTRSLLHEGLIKIVPHAPVFLGVELKDFIAGLEKCQSVVVDLSPETVGQFSADLIPRMRLV